MESNSKHEGVDRISKLPDALLCHILSFVPTIYAVWTTVLSKRWKKLWISVPNLNFDEEDFPETYRVDKNRIMNFINRTLSFHGSSDIQKFLLCCRREQDFSAKDFSHIGRWIRTAVRRNVVELDLHLTLDSNTPTREFKIPQSLLRSKTLVVLTVYSNCITYAPTKGCFPSLKVLSMSVVWPDTDSFTSLGNFLSCCPILEELSIDLSLRFRDVLNFYISAPLLMTLRISLDHPSSRHWTKYLINAPMLENLYLSDNVLSSYFLESSVSLVRAEIDFKDRFSYDNASYSDEDEFWGLPDKRLGFSNRATPSLEKFSDVKYLSLSGVPSLLKVHDLPAFNNVRQLELTLYDGDYCELLIELLKRSPKMEYLALGDQYFSCRELFSEHSQDRWNPPELVPDCLLSHLKTISLRGFQGSQDEMEVAKYLLKNGEVLKKLTIYPWMHIPRDQWYEQEKLIVRETNGITRKMSVNGIWEIRQTLPFCLLSHLKTIFIKGFKGQRDEMEVAKYLLKNNVVLDKMATSTGDLNCTKEEKLTTNITRLIFPRHVDNVLFSRNSSDIQKFTLCCNSVGDFSRVDGWIRAAIRRNVVELYLDVGSPKDEIFELPQSLFSCKTLMDLTLMSNFIIKPPTSGCFPSLKSLRLDINHPQNNSMEKLFSCCPVLESLFITGSHGNDRFWNFLYRPQQTHLGDAVLNFIISAPELKTLRIYWNSQDGYNKCSFFIAAPKLVRFDLNQNVLTDCFLENAKSLVNATIDLWEHSTNQVQRFAIRSTALLAGISNVKYLFLRSHRLKVSVP
ncbi:hypothetical protein TB2_007764 [Malus domestica]